MVRRAVAWPRSPSRSETSPTRAERLEAAARDLADDELLALYIDKQRAHVAQLRGDPREVLTLYRIAVVRLRHLRGGAAVASENAADISLQAASALLDLHGRGERIACPIDCEGCDPLDCAARLIADAERATPLAPGPRARLHFYRARLASWAQGDPEGAKRGEVRDEVLPGRELPDEQKILAAFAQGGLRVCERTPAKPELPDLDEGEVACIRLALADTTPALLLMDELAGRAIALEQGLRFAGTAAVIGMARTRGLIPSARDVFARLHASDLRISTSVIAEILRRVNEG